MCHHQFSPNSVLDLIAVQCLGSVCTPCGHSSAKYKQSTVGHESTRACHPVADITVMMKLQSDLVSAEDVRCRSSRVMRGINKDTVRKRHLQTTTNAAALSTRAHLTARRCSCGAVYYAKLEISPKRLYAALSRQFGTERNNTSPGTFAERYISGTPKNMLLS